MNSIYDIPDSPVRVLNPDRAIDRDIFIILNALHDISTKTRLLQRGKRDILNHNLTNRL